jgi:hypothetical protein
MSATKDWGVYAFEGAENNIVQALDKLFITDFLLAGFLANP